VTTYREARAWKTSENAAVFGIERNPEIFDSE
jgi:hypothetical protein